jgi:hypothetical protein
LGIPACLLRYSCSWDNWLTLFKSYCLGPSTLPRSICSLPFVLPLCKDLLGRSRNQKLAFHTQRTRGLMKICPTPRTRVWFLAAWDSVLNDTAISGQAELKAAQLV